MNFIYILVFNCRTDLEDFLRQNAIQAVFICGLAFDICVAWTARDAAKLGFLTAVIGDCSKGLSREGIKRTKKEFAELGVPIVCFSDKSFIYFFNL